MNNDVIIRVENLGKKYSLRHLRDQRYVALRDVLVEKATGLFRRSPKGSSKIASASDSVPERTTPRREKPTARREDRRSGNGRTTLTSDLWPPTSDLRSDL